MMYLDASVLAAFFFDDFFATQANRLVTSTEADLLVSDFAAAEFAAVVGRQVRMRRITKAAARDGYADFDTWTARASQRVATSSADIRSAEVLLRRLEFNLSAPDALHLALAMRLGGLLATFDNKLALTAEKLGLQVATA
jgi:uncharacterized protein